MQNMGPPPPWMHPNVNMPPPHVNANPVLKRPPLLPNPKPPPNMPPQPGVTMNLPNNRVSDCNMGPAVSESGELLQMEINLQFPLMNSHHFKVACEKCLVPTSILGFYVIQEESHQCLENILAVQQKGQTNWVKVRERKNHRNFNGQYKLCRHFTGPLPTMCTVGEENCSFSHNSVEQILWTREKEGTFNIQEFILQQRHGGHQGFTLDEVVRKHSGIFTFICGLCFSGHPPRVSVENPKKPGFCSAQGHSWEKGKVLIHAFNESITLIAPRPFFHKTAYFLMCHRQRFCLKRQAGQCTFAHSLVERDFWMLERDTGFTREQIAEDTKMMQVTDVLNFVILVHKSPPCHIILEN